MRAVLVEDQPDIRVELKELIAGYCPDVNLVGEADSVVSAGKLIRSEKPDLLFLDVELPDGTGFDLLDMLDGKYRVIFITGSDAYAIRAFRYAAIDYVMKPVEIPALVDAVGRAVQSDALDAERLKMYKEASAPAVTPDRIALHTAEKIHFVAVKDIIRCLADGNYTKFFLQGGQALLVARTLKDYDKLLEPADFLRVHQSHLVNMSAVKEYVKTDGGYLVMTDGARIPVSTRKKADVLERFGDIPHA